MVIKNLETAARLVVQIQNCNQHQQRTEQGIQEKLDCCVHTVRPAPYADGKEHRDQHGFPEHVEKHCVERCEYAIHQAGHDEKRRHVLRDFLLDHFPASENYQHGGETGEQDEQHGNTVHADMVVDVEIGNPGSRFDELHAWLQRIEMRIQRQRHGKAQHRADQGHPARQRRIAVIATQQ
jgi:hypothetical protein